MIAPRPGLIPAPSWFRRHFLLTGTLVFFLFCAVSILSMFQQSSETTVLRRTVMTSVPGPWDKTIALRVGGITTALVRAGSRFFHLPAEPRAALDSLRGAEVGVYKLREERTQVSRGPILAEADRAMAARGWDRIVGVVQGPQLVAVYAPHKGVTSRRMKCCVAVLDDRNLVIVSARGNLEPLMAIAEKHLPRNEDGHFVAWK